MQKTISMSELSRHAERVAKDIETRKTLYRVKRTSGRDIVMMDLAYYEGWLAAIELMQRPNWRAEWARMDDEAARGLGAPLEDVVNELGLDRPAKPTRRRPAPRDAKPRGNEDRRRASHARRRSA